MVRILEFQRPEESNPAQTTGGKSRDLPKGHSAEIVIFPGVRIERRANSSDDGDPPTRAAKRARGPSRRDQ